MAWIFELRKHPVPLTIGGGFGLSFTSRLAGSP
jgi:hypothetical protein